MSPLRLTLLSASLSFACNIEVENPGTVVGNPGDARARLASVDTSLELDEAELYVGSLTLLACTSDAAEAEDATLDLDVEVDLLGDELFAELPAGDWCAAVLDEESELYLVGSGPDGHELEAEFLMQDLRVSVTQSWIVDGGSYVLELGEPDWLTVERLGLDMDDVELLAEEALAEELAEELATRSAMFEDLDLDGEVGDSEREAGAVAAGDSRTEDLPAGDDSQAVSSGGCARRSSAAGVLLLPVMVFGRRRRRRS